MSGPDAHLPAVKLLARQRALVIAHRGYSDFAPENTLPAFQLALEAGADLVELDCRQTRDHQWVVLHDAELDRTSDAATAWQARNIRVESKTAAEVQALDAGSWFSPPYAGTPVPLLSEALDLIQSQSATLIERKSGEATACIQLLRQKKLINRVVVQSFDWHFLRCFHQQEPRQVLGALGPPTVLASGKRPAAIFRRLHPRWFSELEQTGARAVVWNPRVSPEAVRLFHAKGLKVWVYTVNHPKLANRLLDMRVDGLITNNPALIWRTMALRPK
jgi:glycerophosphoryl diester phosphodiesterase